MKGALEEIATRHLRIGWWTLALFIALGVLLEALHGLKVGWYLDVSTATRRQMWTLAHAHGTLLGVLQIAFALTLRALAPDRVGGGLGAAGSCLNAATILLPLGFFAGGLVIHGGDPGLGILLVPPGGLLLLAAVVLTARAIGAKKH